MQNRRHRKVGQREREIMVTIALLLVLMSCILGPGYMLASCLLLFVTVFGT